VAAISASFSGRKRDVHDEWSREIRHQTDVRRRVDVRKPLDGHESAVPDVRSTAQRRPARDVLCPEVADWPEQRKQGRRVCNRAAFEQLEVDLGSEVPRVYGCAIEGTAAESELLVRHT
jgi:hypothetical protein